MKRVSPWFLSFLGVFGMWEIVLRSELVSAAILAYPSEVVCAIPKFISPAGYGYDTLHTALLSLVAFLVSVPLGIFIGLIIQVSRHFSEPANFFLDFIRSIPATAIVPMLFIMFGIGNATKIAAGAYSSSLIIAVATVSGLRSRNPVREQVIRSLRIVGIQKILLLDIPEAAPHLFVGFRAGISLSLILVVVTEMMIGSNFGLGKVIADMRFTDDRGTLYAAIGITGVVGYVYNKIVLHCERKLLHWQQVSESDASS